MVASPLFFCLDTSLVKAYIMYQYHADATSAVERLTHKAARMSIAIGLIGDYDRYRHP